jgi:phosphatidylserine/phosphatidylglycerophosphate/cardiolipin synthase-like enzyme/uncharacterized membrane protein YdjX (TVP38/TMEM64 family)
MKKGSSIFKEGVNCWRTAHADQVALLIDGKAYFKTLVEVIQNAQRTVYIAGWDFDSSIQLLREDKKPVKLGDFLKQTADRNQDLQIYILIWDWSMIYVSERQWLPLLSTEWTKHRRIHFHLDDEHPIGASQHQKCVIVDGAVAFCGGIDLTSNRWDTPEHMPNHPSRQTPNGKSYGPFHDAQMMVNGEAAASLGDLFRERWLCATKKKLANAGTTVPSSWPQTIKPDITDVEIGIARTFPAYKNRSEVKEVLQLYRETISAATGYIYIENQYLSSGMITQMIADSLRKERGPEIAIVLPKKSSGWLEQNTMDALRNRIVSHLRKADRNGRLVILYPTQDPQATSVFVHSKIFIADDRFLRVGSANLSNRSMGLDSECDLAIDAGDDERTIKAIERVRNRLLGEHLGIAADKISTTWKETNSLQKVISSLSQSNSGRKLTALELKEDSPILNTDLVPQEDLLDPEEPCKIDYILNRFTYEEDPQTEKIQIIKSVIVLGILLGLAAAWNWTPLLDWIDIDTVTAFFSLQKNNVLAPLGVVTVYILAGLLMVPVTLLIGATGIIFSPYFATTYALMGCLSSALIAYGIGSQLRRKNVRRLTGKRLNKISRYLADQGILTIAILRNLPFAPFTVVNILAGASHIKLRDFIIGTAAGMLPGIIAITFFSKSLLSVIKNPSVFNITLATGIAFFIGLGVWWMNKRLSHNKHFSSGNHLE